MTLAVRDEPHKDAHRDSMARGMERGKMPKTLPGLLNWYIVAIRAETPERLHTREPWHDRVSTHEREEGASEQGGSRLGTLAWAGSFRQLLEGSPSAIDEDGFYLTPIRSALSRLTRRSPLMARYLFAVAQAEGDWQRVADDLGYPHELVEAFTDAALRRLWLSTYERTTKGMT